MSWWEWLLLLPVAVVALLMVVLARKLGGDAGDRTGAWILSRPGMSERIKRRPVAFRVGSALITAGLVPYLVVLEALLTGEALHADSAIVAKFAVVAGALIASGLTILAIWWRIAVRD